MRVVTWWSIIIGGLFGAKNLMSLDRIRRRRRYDDDYDPGTLVFVGGFYRFVGSCRSYAAPAAILVRMTRSLAYRVVILLHGGLFSASSSITFHLYSYSCSHPMLTRSFLFTDLGKFAVVQFLVIVKVSGYSRTEY